MIKSLNGVFTMKIFYEIEIPQLHNYLLWIGNLILWNRKIDELFFKYWHGLFEIFLDP